MQGGTSHSVCATYGCEQVIEPRFEYCYPCYMKRTEPCPECDTGRFDPERYTTCYSCSESNPEKAFERMQREKPLGKEDPKVRSGYGTSWG